MLTIPPTTPVPVAGRRITARHASVDRGGQTVLAAIDLTVGAPEVVAVGGPSGAGKSTLLELLAGRRRPSRGRVDTSAGADVLRAGFVPQDDLVHRDLPLRQSLIASAALTVRERPDERAGRVDRVLHELDLADHRHQPVGTLSGGQRKRASIAAELLARPTVLFLDEPTSGLDPLTAAELMATLRGLADDGTAVVLTSHHVDDLCRSDRLVLLDRTGRVAFDGPPADAAATLDAEDLHAVYRRLAAARRLPTDSDASPASRPDQGRVPARAAIPDRDVPGIARQTAVLVARNARVLTRGRLTLAVLLGAPALVIAMMATLFPSDVGTAAPATGLRDQLTFWMAFAAFFFGLTFGLLQIVDEVPIVRREQRLGLRLSAYLAAKVLVLLPLLMAVTTLLVIVLHGLDRLPVTSGGEARVILVTLWLSAAAALALGLAASALVRSAAQAALALPMLCFPQVLFAGAVVPVEAMPAVGRWTSTGLVNRWTFEALRGGIGVAGPVASPLASWAMLVALTAIGLLGARVALGRRMRPD